MRAGDGAGVHPGGAEGGTAAEAAGVRHRVQAGNEAEPSGLAVLTGVNDYANRLCNAFNFGQYSILGILVFQNRSCSRGVDPLKRSEWKGAGGLQGGSVEGWAPQDCWGGRRDRGDKNHAVVGTSWNCTTGLSDTERSPAPPSPGTPGGGGLWVGVL